MKQIFLEEMSAEEKRAVIRRCGADTEQLLAILLELQSLSRRSYIDEDTAAVVADELGLSLAHVHDVITFYAMLSSTPRGRYVLEVCISAPCYLVKSQRVIGWLEAELGISLGETTPDGLFTLTTTPCVGACEIGPVIKVGDEVYGNLDQDAVRRLVAGLRQM